MSQNNKGHKVKFFVGGELIGESDSLSVAPSDHDESKVLRQLGVPMTKEELADFRKRWQETFRKANVTEVIFEEEEEYGKSRKRSQD